MDHKFTNRLIHETSPYLLQHAHNPVDWFPWGEEAFAKAQAENKPILLSVGYSACHWCHVMEHESFEDEKIAGLMNELFVNIKVDREERPDVDEIYMNAVQMLTGRGGWPMTMFLTPDAKPFYGGTYFPPVDRHNLPAFPRLLAGVAQAYRERPQDVASATEKILANLERMTHREGTARPLQIETIANAAASLAEHVDHTHGGLGGAPKFPHSMVFSLFLRQYAASGAEHYLNMATHTLRKMAEGGIYDHLGGGFHRYSVDERWLVPHFEKMLYDNALLVRVYLEAYQATQDSFFRQVAEEILAYVEREMRHPEGGFYSTQDADSEGEEGKFFTWSREEIMQELGEEVGEVFCRYYDVTDVGNFEHKNILHPTVTFAQLAKLFRREESAVTRFIVEAKPKLFAVRESRVKPGRDEKILTSWNGLMISAFAEAYRVLGDARYGEIARRGAEFVLTKLYHEGRLWRSYKDGHAKFNAYLDDYAFFAAALLDLYEATFERHYLDRAVELMESLLTRFWDEQEGGFFFTSNDHEALIARTKSAFDGALPSGNAVAVLTLLRLSYLTENPVYLEKAEKTLRLFYEAMEHNPSGFSHMLGALDFYLQRPKEIVMLGDPHAPETQALLTQLHSLLLPNKTVVCIDPNAQTQESETKLPSAVAGRQQIGGKLTAYVCHNFTCSLPVTEWGELKALLAA
jgi:uncharacterized protein YyaL (SSP411 family)